MAEKTKSSTVKAVTLGVVLGFLPTVGIAWAFAVTAAEHVMGPHLASARQRVHLMCLWAQVQDQNTRAICAKVGAECQVLDARVILESCEERTEDK